MFLPPTTATVIARHRWFAPTFLVNRQRSLLKSSMNTARFPPISTLFIIRAALTAFPRPRGQYGAPAPLCPRSTTPVPYPRVQMAEITLYSGITPPPTPESRHSGANASPTPSPSGYKGTLQPDSAIGFAPTGRASRSDKNGKHHMAVIRRARVTDAPAIAKVYVESWQTTYPGLVPDSYLLGLSEAVSTQRWQTQLSTQRETCGVHVALERTLGLVGFGSCGHQRTAIPGHEGEVYTLYLLDSAQGRGLGRRLLSAMAADLMAKGLEGMVVWVLRDNPSRWFYERLGGQRLAEQTICLGRALLPEIAYGWRDLAELARLPINPPLE